MNSFFKTAAVLTIGLFAFPTVFIHGEDELTYDEPQGNAIYWCSPEGSYESDQFADGSEENPFFDVQLAIDKVKPGDRICMKAGTYKYNKRIKIDFHNGTEDNMIELWGVDGQAILDFSDMPYHIHSDNFQQGIRLTSSFWHLKNLDICNASDNGLLIERFRYDEGPLNGTTTKDEIMAATDQAHHNIIELCNFYRNNDAGVQLKNMASYNTFINCDSYFNADTNYRDPVTGQENREKWYGDADGFAPKISCGTGNYFYGCRAWNNSDDGWDSYYKESNGYPDNIVVILDNCLTFRNGMDEDRNPQGNGNGFKMGSKEGRTNYILTRCAAVDNLSKGFDRNSNTGQILMINCTDYMNGYTHDIYQTAFQVTNCIALNRDYGTYNRVTKADPLYFEDSENFEELIGSREPNGNLPYNKFLRPRENSSLVDKGQPVPAWEYRMDGITYPIPELWFSGDAPDLGAYEVISDILTGIKVSVVEKDNSLSLFQATDGTIFLTLNDADPIGEFTANLYDTAGNLLAHRDFTGTTVAIHLPSSAAGLCVIAVEGSGNFRRTIKTLLK